MELGKIKELNNLLTYLSLVANKQTNQAKTETLKERKLLVILDIYIMMAHGTMGFFSENLSNEIQLTFY